MSILRNFIRNKCDCGTYPDIRTAQVAEDVIATWVECPTCKTTGEVIEDAYNEPATATDVWNRGRRFKASS